MRKSILISSALLMLMALLVYTGCKKKGPEPTFDRKGMLDNIYHNSLEVVHANFTAEVTTLKSDVDAFVSNPTTQTLEAVQSQWYAAKYSWEQCEVYEIRSVADLFLHNKIDKWPSNEAFIENNLEGTDMLDETFVENTGSNVKGLPAMEYLLWDELGNSQVLINYASDSLATRRGDYLSALSANLITQATHLQQVWEEEESAFVEEIGNSAEGTLNQLVNAQVGLLEEIVGGKLGRPLGKSDGGTPQPEDPEADHSGHSLAMIKSDLIGLKNSFHTGSDSLNLVDLLDFLEAEKDGALLSDLIMAQLDVCITQVDITPAPLSESVVSQPAQVELLYDEIRDLLALIKVDMANRLGITITFTDNDGD